MALVTSIDIKNVMTSTDKDFLTRIKDDPKAGALIKGLAIARYNVVIKQSQTATIGNTSNTESTASKIINSKVGESVYNDYLQPTTRQVTGAVNSQYQDIVDSQLAYQKSLLYPNLTPLSSSGNANNSAGNAESGISGEKPQSIFSNFTGSNTLIIIAGFALIAILVLRRR